MNLAQDKINKIEQYAIQKNIYSKYEGDVKNTITESMVNDLRIKYSRDSEWGDILNICRKFRKNHKAFYFIDNKKGLVDANEIWEGFKRISKNPRSR